MTYEGSKRPVVGDVNTEMKPHRETSHHEVTDCQVQDEVVSGGPHTGVHSYY